MNRNRVTWALVSILVLTTCFVSFGTSTSSGHDNPIQEPQPTPEGADDLSRYALVDYYDPETTKVKVRRTREQTNQRYDKQHFVTRNPGPEDSSIIRRNDEVFLKPALPKSPVVVIGQTTRSAAFLSNDKQGIYTEFTFRIDEVLKGDSSIKSGSIITFDRMGGLVRYPNGQKVLYITAGQDLPRVGDKLLLFLDSDAVSPNYRLTTAYTFGRNTVSPLDEGQEFEPFKASAVSDFLNTVRKKLSLTAPNLKD